MQWPAGSQQQPELAFSAVTNRVPEISPSKMSLPRQLVSGGDKTEVSSNHSQNIC
jgi:hypothetical protein